MSGLIVKLDMVALKDGVVCGSMNKPIVIVDPVSRTGVVKTHLVNGGKRVIGAELKVSFWFFMRLDMQSGAVHAIVFIAVGGGNKIMTCQIKTMIKRTRINGIAHLKIAADQGR